MVFLLVCQRSSANCLFQHESSPETRKKIISHTLLNCKLTPNQIASVVSSPLLAHGHKEGSSLSVKQFQPEEEMACSNTCFSLLLNIKHSWHTVYSILIKQGHRNLHWKWILHLLVFLDKMSIRFWYYFLTTMQNHTRGWRM